MKGGRRVNKMLKCLVSIHYTATQSQVHVNMAYHNGLLVEQHG